MEKISHKIGNFYRSVASNFMSLPTETHFLEKGTLTPEEFQLAGDQLVHRCPTWSWSPSAPGCEQKHLPDQQQFLITRGVPCRKRIKNIQDSDQSEQETEEGYVLTHAHQEGPEEIGEITLEQPQQDQESEGEIPDISDMQGEQLLDQNAASIFGGNYVQADEPEESIVRTRVYDLSVTYDTYYQTPRLWLSGYDENMVPLTPQQMFEDIMEDYANKTVTIEKHPCLGTNQVSIHPCNHAKMMKSFIEILAQNGTEAKVHHAMFVFLKFLSSVVPTIEYDFTVDLSLE